MLNFYSITILRRSCKAQPYRCGHILPDTSLDSTQLCRIQLICLLSCFSSDCEAWMSFHVECHLIVLAIRGHSISSQCPINHIMFILDQTTTPPQSVVWDVRLRAYCQSKSTVNCRWLPNHVHPLIKTITRGLNIHQFIQTLKYKIKIFIKKKQDAKEMPMIVYSPFKTIVKNSLKTICIAKHQCELISISPFRWRCWRLSHKMWNNKATSHQYVTLYGFVYLEMS